MNRANRTASDEETIRPDTLNPLRRWTVRDEGSVSIMFAVLFAAVLVFIVGLADSGKQITTAQRADNLAAEAARAAGQMIDLPEAVSGGVKRVNPELATKAALSYLERAGAKGTVEFPDLQHITVTATVTYDPILHFGTAEYTAQASAQLVTG